VLAVRRLDHFKSWILEGFGRSESAFKHVFAALGAEHGKPLTRKTLVEGAPALGYPCGPDALSSIFSLLDRNFDGEVSAQDFERLRNFSGEELLTGLEALKRLADEKLGGIDASYKQFQAREQQVQGCQHMPKSASFEAVEKVCQKEGFSQLAPGADLKMLFLFLSVTSDAKGNGYIEEGDWGLLKGLNARAVSGSPARLRRILKERLGGVDQAFEKMHTSWIQRALIKGMKQTAFGLLAHALCVVDGFQPLQGDGAASTAEAARGGRKLPPARPSSLGVRRPLAPAGDCAGGTPQSEGTWRTPTRRKGPGSSRAQSARGGPGSNHRWLGCLPDPSPLSVRHGKPVSAIDWERRS
jgi:hypothetical protein